jgi:hypothetical protein
MTKTYYPHKLAEYITIVLIFAIAYPIFYYHFEILRAWIGMRVEVNYYTYLYYILFAYIMTAIFTIGGWIMWNQAIRSLRIQKAAKNGLLSNKGKRIVTRANLSILLYIMIIIGAFIIQACILVYVNWKGEARLWFVIILEGLFLIGYCANATILTGFSVADHWVQIPKSEV